MKISSHEQTQVGSPATLLAILPDTCNTPDGMCLLPDNSIIVSIPNFNEENPKLNLKAHGGRLIKITPDNKAEEFYVFPNHIRPFGIARAPNSSLYVADLQYFNDKNQKSRIWRLDIKNDQVEKIVLMASGLNVANGVAIHNGFLYITESVLIEGSSPLISAVLRFRLDEENVTLKTPLQDDPHVFAIFRSTTANSKKWAFGADGIAFDSKGNLFIGLFGDGVIYKVVFNKEGTIVSNTIFSKAPGQMINCDGMSCDKRTDKLYVADSANNAVQVIHPDGKVETLSMNGVVPNTTSKLSGLLVQPCEALVRGDTIVVSNMDWPFADFKNEKIGYLKPATLSVIPFKK